MRRLLSISTNAQARPRLESRTRDLMHQIDALAAGKPDLRTKTLAWMLAVLEVGHAAIELRLGIARLSDPPPAMRTLTHRALSLKCADTFSLYGQK